MLNFKNLIYDIKDPEKIEDHLLSFFVKKNFKEYEIDESADKDQVKAIKIMFESKKGLSDRVNAAIQYDPFCREAFFVYMMISEDVYVQLRFKAYYDEINNFANLDEYEKKCYLSIMNLYVDFLLDISNITAAIKINRLLIKLSGKASKSDISRLAYMYHSIENSDEFYRLYLNYNFGAYEYILLLVTLLKNEEELKAREVLMEMYENIEHSIYLDHVWDLDEEVPEHKDFIKVVNDCYEDISAIPTFFSWVNKVREKNGK